MKYNLTLSEFMWAGLNTPAGKIWAAGCMFDAPNFSLRKNINIFSQPLSSKTS